MVKPNFFSELTLFLPNSMYSAAERGLNKHTTARRCVTACVNKRNQVQFNRKFGIYEIVTWEHSLPTLGQVLS